MIACNMLLYCGITMRDDSGFPDTAGYYAEKHIKTYNLLGLSTVTRMVHLNPTMKLREDKLL